jgi:hypothetical protein
LALACLCCCCCCYMTGRCFYADATRSGAISAPSHSWWMSPNVVVVLCAPRKNCIFFFRHERNLIKKQPLLLYNTEISSFLEKYEKKNEMFQKRRR